MKKRFEHKDNNRTGNRTVGKDKEQQLRYTLKKKKKKCVLRFQNYWEKSKISNFSQTKSKQYAFKISKITSE